MSSLLPPRSRISLQQLTGRVSRKTLDKLDHVVVITSAKPAPQDWRDMGMEQGTPFALAHTFFQTGPFRPNNVTKKIPGLVFTGSSTPPGVGVPMVLVSGKLAAERVDQYAARK